MTQCHRPYNSGQSWDVLKGRSGRLWSRGCWWGQRWSAYWWSHWSMNILILSKLVMNMIKLVQNWWRRIKMTLLSWRIIYGIWWMRSGFESRWRLNSSWLASRTKIWGCCIEFVVKLLHILLVKWRRLSSWRRCATWGSWTMTLICTIVACFSLKIAIRLNLYKP